MMSLSPACVICAIIVWNVKTGSAVIANYSGLQLNTVPQPATNATTLLDLSRNKIIDLEKHSLLWYGNVSVLYLQRNSLTIIQEGVFQGLNLNILDLSHNSPLSEFPAALKDVAGSLKELKISSCRIRSNNSWMTDADVSFANLIKLDVSANELTSVEWLPSLPNLRHLNAAQNNITTIEPIASLARLEYLNLGFNFIGSIPELGHLTGKLFAQVYIYTNSESIGIRHEHVNSNYDINHFPLNISHANLS